jgi:TatA/E family protein of Tat protein translocase
MPFGLGFGETILILAVILLFFGPKRLPDAAASMGKGIREFRRAMNGFTEELTTPQSTAAPPLPPHSTFAGPGADPYAVAADAPEPLATHSTFTGPGADPHAVALETPEPLPPPAEPVAERRPEDPPA